MLAREDASQLSPFNEKLARLEARLYFMADEVILGPQLVLLVLVALIISGFDALLTAIYCW